MLRINMRFTMFNSHCNWIVIWLDSYFSRNFTLDNITVWYIGSNFNFFISLTLNYLLTDFMTIFFVDDCLSSGVSTVSNNRILARISRHNSLVTDSLAIDQSCVSWNWRYIDRLNLSWVVLIVLVLGCRGALRIFIDYIA